MTALKTRERLWDKKVYNHFLSCVFHELKQPCNIVVGWELGAGKVDKFRSLVHIFSCMLRYLPLLPCGPFPAFRVADWAWPLTFEKPQMSKPCIFCIMLDLALNPVPPTLWALILICCGWPCCTGAELLPSCHILSACLSAIFNK